MGVDNSDIIKLINELKEHRIIISYRELTEMTGYSKAAISNYIHNREPVSKKFRHRPPFSL